MDVIETKKARVDGCSVFDFIESGWVTAAAFQPNHVYLFSNFFDPQESRRQEIREAKAGC